MIYIGDRVRVHKANARGNGEEGTVCGFDPNGVDNKDQLYFIKTDSGEHVDCFLHQITLVKSYKEVMPRIPSSITKGLNTKGSFFMTCSKCGKRVQPIELNDYGCVHCSDDSDKTIAGDR